MGVGRLLPSQPQQVELPPLHLQMPLKVLGCGFQSGFPRTGFFLAVQEAIIRKDSHAFPFISSFLYLCSFPLSIFFLPDTNCSLQTPIVEILESTEKLKKSEITYNPAIQR